MIHRLQTKHFAKSSNWLMKAIQIKCRNTKIHKKLLPSHTVVILVCKPRTSLHFPQQTGNLQFSWTHEIENREKQNQSQMFEYICFWSEWTTEQRQKIQFIKPRHFRYYLSTRQMSGHIRAKETASWMEISKPGYSQKQISFNIKTKQTR